MLAKGAVAKVLAALGITYAAPFVIVTGAAAGAIYGLGKALKRLANAPMVRSSELWERVRFQMKEEFSRLAELHESEIDKLIPLRAEAIQAWKSAQAAEQRAEAELQQARAKLKEVEDLVQALRTALNIGGEDAKTLDLQTMKGKAEDLKDQVIAGVTRVKAIADTIDSRDKALEIIGTYRKCEKLVAELALLAGEARQIKTAVDKIKTDPESVKQKLSAIDVHIRNTKLYIDEFRAAYNEAKNKWNLFEFRRVQLTARQKMLRRVLPENIYAVQSEEERANFKTLEIIREQMGQIHPITEFSPDFDAEGKAITLNKESDTFFAKMMGLNAELFKLNKSLESWRGGDAETIEAAAREAIQALKSIELLLKKAQDFLAGKVNIPEDLTLSVHIQDGDKKPIPNAQVEVNFKRSKGQNKDFIQAQKKLLQNKAKTKDREQLKKTGRIPKAKSAVTNATGDVNFDVKPGWEMEISASAGGFKAASAIKRTFALSSHITLTLTADEYGDKIFLFKNYHTEPKLLRMYGPRVALFLPPYSDDPESGSGYFVELWYVDAGQAKALQEQLKKKGDKNANLPIHDLFRHLNLAYGNRSLEIKEYTEPYTIGIECNGQKRYFHSFSYKDLNGSDRQSQWGGGFHSGMSPGEKEASVTVFDVEGKKMAEFPIKFMVERNPNIDLNEKREMIREARANLSEATGDPDRVAVLLAVIIQLTSANEAGPPSRIFPQFGQFVQAWHSRVRDNLAKGEKFYDPLGQMDDICERVATPEALTAYEGALSLLESNIQRIIHWDESYVARHHRRAALFAIMFSNDFRKAIHHLERSLHLDNAGGKDVDQEEERKKWPRFGKKADKKFPQSEGHSEREGAEL